MVTSYSDTRHGHKRAIVVALQTAGHVGKPGVELIPIRAFRIEPFRPLGFMSCDAESVPFGPVQGQILGQKARLFAAS